MAENYDLIFGQGASSQYAWSDSDYQKGWQTVGSTPPTAEQFDALQRRSDTKAKDLNNRLSPLETTASKALARVTPAANRLPYFNSSNSATTTAISDFTKTLLDDKDAKTARATLGAPSTTGANASGSWNINAATATKLATARKIGGVSFDGSADITLPGVNAAGTQNTSGKATTAGTADTAKACSGNAATATKLATARKINITGNATGAATFDGSKDVSISVTVDESKHAGNADTATSAGTADTAKACSGNAATATKLADESGNNYLNINTTTDRWDVLGSNPGAWLKSIRTNGNAPPYSIGNYSAAVAFGVDDTKGIITLAFDKPTVKFAGGNGSTAYWKFAIQGGYNNETYDLNNFPTKTGGGASGTWGISISGNADTATKLATARAISLTGNASGSANFDGSGNVSINTTVNESKHAAAADTATSATNADKLDGAHLADVYRRVGGHNTPTITSIIDWNTMKACNGGTDVRNINNTTYGVTAYGGDSNFSSGVLKGYAKGSFYLTQDYTNFDKLCFLFCSDTGKDIEYTMTDVFLLNYIMTNYSVVNLSHDDADFWIVTGYSNKGTAKDKVSTKRIFSAPASMDANNCGIVDVLGIKY